jgi:hypothetical protein
MVTCNPVNPNPYSKATTLYQAVRDILKPCITARVVAGNVLLLSPESASNILSSDPSDHAND